MRARVPKSGKSGLPLTGIFFFAKILSNEPSCDIQLGREPSLGWSYCSQCNSENETTPNKWVFRCAYASSHFNEGLSVGPSVRNACAKIVFRDLFWPWWNPILNITVNKRVLGASFTTDSFHLSIRPSVSPYTVESRSNGPVTSGNHVLWFGTTKSYIFPKFSFFLFFPLPFPSPSSDPLIFKTQLSGKKSKSVFDFLTYSRETWFSFSYGEVGNLDRANVASDKIDGVSKFDNSLSFGAKQNSLRQIFFELWIFQSFFT